MNRKMFLLTLCFTILLAPMLFGSETNDAIEPMPKLESIKIVPVQNLPKVLDQQRQEDSLYYCNNLVPANAVGFSGALDWEGAMRLTPTELGAYAGWNIIAISWYHWGTTGYSQNVKVYDEGTPTSPGPVLTTEPYTTSTQEWVRVDLSNPVTISGSGDLWCSIEISQTAADFVIGVDDGPAVDGKGDWIYYSGGWDELQNLGLDYNWHILAIVEQAAAATFWDFETGWQGWTHTNGLIFPEAWDVEISGLHSIYTPPAAGDSSMWIDSDDAGSAAWVQDTALSPVVVPPTNMTWMKWGVGYNQISTDEIYEVGLKYFDGAIWTVVPLVNYTSDVYPMWDSVDVSAYASYDSVQVYFYYDDGDHYAWYAAFDNVELYAPAGHDVGSVAFLSPGPMVAPGTEDVIGVVHNFGASDETYDVHCVVTDPSVVLDVTLNVTTLVGESDTLNFGSVVFQDGYTYDLMMATLLVDDDPTNDTLYQSTYCTSVYWEILTDMPYTASGAYVGYSMDAASNTYVHVFGGNPSAQDDHYIYDVTNASWSAGTPLPTGATYGGDCSIDNKIYMIGAWTAGPNALITIYDADNDIYTTRAIPTGLVNDAGIAVKDNNLIYIVGGGPGGWSATTIVNVFDVAGDSFFTNVTQLPAADPKAFAGTAMITGDTIVVAAGYGLSGSEDKVLLGAIDPANPAIITWSTGPAYPGGATYRGSGDTWLGVGYFTCGSSALTSTYAYVAGTGWVTLPDKPTGAMNVGFAMAPVDTSLVDDVEGYGFACGGYSPYMSTFEALHTGVITGIAEKPDEGPEILKFSFKLLTSNPVTNTARIQFVMPSKGPVSFSVYDVTGRTVMTNNYSSISRGTHTVIWKCNDNTGKKVASGSYFYRIEADGNVATGKLIIFK